MFKNLIILSLSVFMLFSCSGKNKDVKVAEPTEEEKILAIYSEAVEALKKGDAFFASKKFEEAEALLPQSKWAAKASIMSAYAHYNRSAYERSIFASERHISTYPSDENVSYAHYLIAMCYYEQILDEKKI